MRIVIDLQSCQTEGSRSRGIGRYSTDLTRAIAKQAGEREIWLALNGNFVGTVAQIRQDFGNYIPPERMFVYDMPDSVSMHEARHHWRRQAAERIREYALNALNPDIVHISSLFEGLGDNAVTSVKTFDKTTPTAVTLYDLIPLIKSETYLENAVTRSWYNTKIESLKKADLLLAISESSRREALEFLEMPTDKVVAVSTAVGDQFETIDFSPEQIRTLQTRYCLNRPFIMYTGGIDYRKNIEGLIEAYSKLSSEVRSRHQLAIVCSMLPHERNRIKSIANRHRLTDNEIVLTGFVPEEDLVALYNLCELFVFPSLHEGFGLPALEAMHCGAVVIGANNSSIPEVIGRSDALFDSTRVEEITLAINNGLTNEGFRRSFRELAKQQITKFSWKASAQKALEAYDALHDRQQSSKKAQIQVPAVSVPTESKPSLAFVSPFPPAQSGIAEYSAELLPFLTRHYDITVVVDKVEPHYAFVNAATAVQPIEWFSKHADDFDRRLYHFGNSSLHHHMFKLLERYPGVVVLHDFYLSGALNWMDTFVGPPGVLAKQLYLSHGYKALLTLFEETLEAATTHYPINKSVIENAAEVIVHSQHSREIAKQWYGQNAGRDWHIVPQHHTRRIDISKQEAREQLGFKEDDFVVCSFGIVAPTKLNDKLLSAWLGSHLSTNKRCHLVFVGSNNKEEYGQRLEAIIKENSEANIKITGFASAQSYRQYLAAADVAVQLRTLSRGETSRAALEVLTYQLPLIINSHGAMAEYPDDVVIKLPDDFNGHQLVEALEKLYNNAELRHSLGQLGYQYVTEHHAPAQVASRYRDVIESFVKDGPYRRYRNLLNSFTEIQCEEGYQEGDLAATAEAIARNTETIGKPQLLVDISSWMQKVLNAQSKKAIKASVIHLLKQPAEAYRVEPIYFDGKIYRYARLFTLKLLDLNLVKGLGDDPVDISKKDLFLGLATEKVLTAESLHQTQKWHEMGVEIHSAVFEESTQGLLNNLQNTDPTSLAQRLFSISRYIFCSPSIVTKQIQTQTAQLTNPAQYQPHILNLPEEKDPVAYAVSFLSLINRDITH